MRAVEGWGVAGPARTITNLQGTGNLRRTLGRSEIRPHEHRTLEGEPARRASRAGRLLSLRAVAQERFTAARRGEGCAPGTELRWDRSRGGGAARHNRSVPCPID